MNHATLLCFGHLNTCTATQYHYIPVLRVKDATWLLLQVISFDNIDI